MLHSSESHSIGLAPVESGPLSPRREHTFRERSPLHLHGFLVSKIQAPQGNRSAGCSNCLFCAPTSGLLFRQFQNVGFLCLPAIPLPAKIASRLGIVALDPTCNSEGRCS